MASHASRALLVGAMLVPVATATRQDRSVVTLYQPGEEHAWVFEQDGKRVGWHVLRYEGAVGPVGTAIHHFVGRVEIDSMPQVGLPRQRYLGDLFTDGSGHPVRQVLEATIGDAYSRVELSIAEGKAAAEVVQGPSKKQLSIDVPDGVFLQANNFIGYFELMLALSPVDAKTIEASLLACNGLQVLPYHAKEIGKLETQDGAKVAGSKLEDSLGQVISLAADGRLLGIEMPAQKLRILPSKEQFEAFSIEPPETAPAATDLDVEPVEIRHEGVVLAGEISRPRGASGRLPAVFFISGSGLQDRNGYSSGIDLGTHEILDRLTREGFLVLRVDDRGAGESKAPVASLSFDDLIADARACVDHLFARDDVDPERIALIGHSEGGCTAPILAAEQPRIAAVVLMAATGRPIQDVILEQNGQALDLAGIKGKEREKILADVQRYLDLVSGDAKIEPDEIPADYRDLLTFRPWLQSHARQDQRANLQRVHCPVLILQGAKDFQVSPERDARLIAKTLDEAGHTDHQLVVLPDLDHLFKRVKGERSELAEYFERRPVDPSFLDALVKWLAEHLHVKGG